MRAFQTVLHVDLFSRSVFPKTFMNEKRRSRLFRDVSYCFPKSGESLTTKLFGPTSSSSRNVMYKMDVVFTKVGNCCRDLSV